MKGFNLSDWALSHRSMVWYFMLVFVVAGIFSYLNLGREEDPAFTIKTMIIQANWPGASVKETVQQVTDRIEKKLEELDSLDYTKSVTTAGQTVVFVNLKDTTKARDVVPNWLQVRNMVNDIKAQLPQGVQGPFFNDRFGDVYGNIYAFTADGLTPRQLRDYVEDVRTKILTVPNAGKVDLVGAQDEAIYLEFSTRQIAALGLNQQQIVASLQAQNAITPSGVIQSGPERISVRVGGQFTSEESLRAINLRVNDRFFRLSDVATIRRGYVDPPTALFRFNGQDAIGLAIGMKPNANLLKFGEALHEEMQKVLADLPVGVGVHLVADQPVIVEEAVSGFTRALFEAVAIVLAVSFISLGLRAGFVVALSIPLVLAITFTVMAYLGISLQRISLGALIIALGLLVDDAMIAVEMMVARLEVGDNLRKAATFVYTSTAFPMLTGTVVTIAGFVPVGFAKSGAGEYCFSLFAVVVLSATAGLFALAVVAMGFVGQEFFPKSDRPEVMLDLTLPRTASIKATDAVVERVEKLLASDPGIDHWSFYVGQGAVRFYLPLDAQLANDFFAQAVVVTKGHAVRQAVIDRLERELS
ncbi:MAG: efflux RND transporter permease subunit, partial [Mesorhizobium sp.]